MKEELAHCFRKDGHAVEEDVQQEGQGDALVHCVQDEDERNKAEKARH